jgi:glutathione S-transferase
MTQAKITLHGTPLSGHTHRVELLLRALELDFDFVPAPANVRSSEEFRTKLNPARPDPGAAGRRPHPGRQQCHPGLSRQALRAGQRLAPAGTGRRGAGAALALDRRWRGHARAGDRPDDRAVQLRGRPCEGRARRGAAASLHGRASGQPQLPRPPSIRRSPTLACYSYVAHAPEGRHPARRLSGGAGLGSGASEALPFLQSRSHRHPFQ